MKTLEVVIAIITDDQEKLLFQHRKKQPYKKYLGLVGGKIEKDESKTEALIREIQEETALIISEALYLGTIIETLLTEKNETDVSLHVFVVKAEGQMQASEKEGDLFWIKKNTFLQEKEKYIPTDWLIVRSFIQQNSLPTQIVVKNKGETYEIKSAR
jgi:ADP-ribose pyrophosphatase YjhB (NUDIX family)